MEATPHTPKMAVLPIAEIVIGLSNPRKEFDEDAIQEISASIKSKGVIQPILVRPLPAGNYELVCGERRYRGSIIAGMADIPAYIRELTDDEAFELQITENLQRKDVHPLEEAFAIKRMIEKNDVAEIAAKLGKNVYFVKQRLKLNDLTPDWQRAFYKNLIKVTDALSIALFKPEVQDKIVKDMSIEKEITANRKIEINKWHLRQYRGFLKEAKFSPNSETLDRSVGSCNNCAFNTAYASLFKDSGDPVCTNFTCYQNKE